MITANPMLIKANKELAGNLRQIIVYRTGNIKLPKHSGWNPKMVNFVLDGWCNSLLVTTLLMDNDGGANYHAEINLNGKKVSPYDEVLVEYLNKFKAEFDACKSDEFYVE